MANDNRYTNLSFDDLIQLFNDLIQSDPRFQNISNSSIFAIFSEIIAGVGDLNNYAIERRFVENFLDTAKLKSSVIQLAKNIGYVVQRPIPAETALSMTIQGPLPNGLAAGNILYLNRKTEFTLDGVPFILKNTYQYIFTTSDITNGVGNTNFSKVINFGLVSNSDNYDLIVSASSISADSVVDIVLMQGEIKSKTILGTDTDQINLIFQKYKIEDDSFSNVYSENDLGFDSDNNSYDQSQNLTRVAINTFDVFAAEEAGTLTNYDSFYDIDNKTLLKVDSALTQTFTSAIPLCLIQTTPDGQVRLEFNDGIFGKKGLTSTSQNIYIQYLSTLGKKANQIGVIGQQLQTSEQFLVNGIDISNNLSFSLRKNILGGADLEDIESIRVNAPGNFSSQERCVSKKDYISYLKSLTSPINVKNAIAWGEQEETRSTSGSPIKKLFNVALFSLLGELYDVDSDTHQVRMTYGSSESNILSAALLDDSYSPYTISSNHWLNLFIKERVIDELNYNNSLPSTSRVKTVLNKLDSRVDITVRPIYVTPFINEFDLIGTVKVKKLSNINYIQKTVNNAIYEFLNLKADFDTPIYISDIVNIIKKNTNVVYCDVGFTPYETNGVTFDFNHSTSAIVDADISGWSPVGNETIDAIEDVYSSNIARYLGERTSYIFTDETLLFDSVQARNMENFYLSDFTERNFYNDLCKRIYNDLKSLAAGNQNCFADSVNFNNTILKLRNTFDYMIKFDMIDTNGNISIFSMNNQIAKIRIQLTYLYN